jgi:dienelactone hydrolase
VTKTWAYGGAAIAALLSVIVIGSTVRIAGENTVDERTLREYAGAYRWSTDGFVYLQLWNEFAGVNELVAFDESGEVRTLYPAERDRFTAGPGAAVPTPVESRIEFERNATGAVVSLTWRREGTAPRKALRLDSETHEDVRFTHGDLVLAGTLIAPRAAGPHPAVVLVHGSGPAAREAVLPYARFLVRRGLAVLAYDKRGVGGSTGDWDRATFDDLAADVVAAAAWLRTRRDIDPGRIGLLGISQAGWVMPLAAARVRDLAFLISISGPGIAAAETTLDQARNEMTSRGMRPQAVDRVVSLMQRQYDYVRTGAGWDAYLAERSALAARMGPAPPDTFPDVPDHPLWDRIRRLYFYDPAPTLRQLRVPTLALFGALDNNIVAEKNQAAWEAALKAGGHPDYTLRVLPGADHLQLEARIGSNAEMPSLQRFVPDYFTTVERWLAARAIIPAR